jgi:hypothetical protein
MTFTTNLDKVVISIDNSDGKDKSMVTFREGSITQGVIDFTELQDEAIAQWDKDGVDYSYTETITTDPCPMYQSYIRDEYQDILDDPMRCLVVLGFDKISDYLRSKTI